MGDKQYTARGLASHLRDLADGPTAPTRSEVNDADGPSVSTYERYWGSWENAVGAAGLKNRKSGQVYTDKELLEFLREIADRRTPPSKLDVKESHGPSPSTYKNRFGSWNEAVEEAGLNPRKRRTSDTYSKEILIKWIHLFVDECGYAPIGRDIRGWNGPSLGTYYNYFDSFDHAVREAGYEPGDGRPSP